METGLGIAYTAMVVMALVPIYIGSYRSLNQKPTETLSSQDAWSFPVVGSCFLFGLYGLFKIFSKEYINMLLTGYFTIFSMVAVTTTISPWIERLLPSQYRGKLISILFHSEKAAAKQTFTRGDIISMILSLILGIWYCWQKHWIANNVIGLAFCIQAISFLSIGSYKIGCILLGGLFVYDIFWVFGTDVMISVAKAFDAPVKLLFPKDIFAEQFQFSMLGLGDIVLPGFLIAFLLRFDYKTVLKLYQDSKKRSLSTPYFSITLLAYLIGLVTTIFVMHTFQAGQPALLYLVPCCLGASLLMAFIRGEFNVLWNYSEENPAKIQKKKIKQQNQQPKQQQPKIPIKQKNESKKIKESKTNPIKEKSQQTKENNKKFGKNLGKVLDAEKTLKTKKKKI